MEELFDKSVKCPICGEDFKTKKVKSSKLRVMKRDTDLLTYYRCEQPIKYSATVCPRCGYTAMDHQFNHVNKGQKIIIKENVAAFWGRRDYCGHRTLEDGLKCMKLSLYCAELLERKKYELGNISLRVAWLNRLSDNTKEERRFLQYAVKLLTQAFYEEDFLGASIDDVTIAYLVGEIHRRLDNKKEAITWFSNVLSTQGIKGKPRIEKLAREQWRLTREIM